MPAEMEDFRLCELFHCLPSQLDSEDYHRIGRMIAFREIELRLNAKD